MWTCAAVIQGVKRSFMGWSLHGKILFWWTDKIQKNQGYHDDRRAKHSYKQTCYLPGVSPAGIRTQNRLLVFNNVGTSLFFVLCSYLGRSLDQADACHMASVYLGFCSIWNTHFCHRLQPHLYPVPVETSVGRSDGKDSDISQRMSSPRPLSVPELLLN
jgi:hypothetical protein